MEIKIYQCSICGQIAALIKESGSPLVCCGKEMTRLIPDSVDASLEKHVPVICIENDTVTVSVGSAPHPMSKEHSIEWILLETKCGVQYKALQTGREPKACFCLCKGDTVRAAYAYCNLHGLWKAELR